MKNLNVRWKVLVLTFIAALLLAAIGYSGYDATKKLADASERMYNETVKVMAILDEVRSNNLARQSIALEMIVTSDDTIVKRLQDELLQTKEANDALYEQIESSRMSPEMSKQYGMFQTILPDYRTAIDKVVALAENGENDQAYGVFEKIVQPLRVEMNGKLKTISELQAREAETNSQKAMALKAGSLVLILSLLIGGLILLLVTGYLIARAISNPLRNIQQLMQNAENGDLTVRADYVSRDEIGLLSASFNGMIGGLRVIIQKVDESAVTLSASAQQLTASAEQTSVASGHIASSSGQLSDGFETQTQSVAEVTNSAEQLADNMNNIRGGSESIAELAGHTESSARDGLNEVQDVLRQMQDIESSVGHAGSVIVSLERQIEDIDMLVSAIQQVAKQTNLLALNASIEAARAGEAGRGFDVVAQEIRKLAESAAQSASEITETVRSVQGESRKAVVSMDEAAGRVKHGVEGAGRVSESFAAIQQSIADVSGRIGQISHTIASASGQSTEIGRAMQSISRVTEQGAAGLQEVSAASEEQLSTMEEVNGSARHLSRLAEELQQEMTKFTL
ncbi:methyl-accepting chemotaxis protein [Saccharibacillus deserti]|uniref:methyl-accepting chemotaxis protein n=1 Tax=Saccharibacillus deserti TaxID=1634444 RepID=UPI001554CB09|nr:methyl-accepting chemotaxis protein [Saccharibacillus deserti]